MSEPMVSPRRLTGPQIRDLRESYWGLMDGTRTTATRVREHLAMQGGITLPEGVTDAAAKDWISRLPHQFTGPQRVLQKLIGRKWEIKRSVTSGGYGAASVATRLEQPLNSIMRDKQAGFPWAPANDLILNEGLAFGTVSLAPTDWQQGPSLYRPGTDTLEPKALEKRFSFDANDRLRGEDGYDESTVDLDRARKLMTDEMHDHMARHLPFRQRVYSIRSCAPIWGPSFDLEGLIVEENWTAQRLVKRKVYIAQDGKGVDSAQLYPLGNDGNGSPENATGGTGKPVKVTSAWLTDEDGLPYVSYVVDGKAAFVPSKANDGLEPWTVDLSKLGPEKNKQLTRLPISWGWGLGWPAADLDERAMAFIAPFLQSWKQLDSLMTMVVVYAAWKAFPALIEKVAIGDPDIAGLEDDEDQSAPDINFMRITRVHGEITEVGGNFNPTGLLQTVAMLQGENKAEQPGGEQGAAPSGFAMSMGAAFEADALATVHDATLGMATMHASHVLEGAKVLGECYEPVRVYELADVLIQQQKPSSTKQMLILDPELIGDSFDVEAVSIKTPGENPAVRQQNAGLVKEGFYDKVWFLEQDGYASPEEMAMRVAWQQILESEPGQAATVRMLEQYVSDTFTKQIIDAIANRQANEQGLPAGAAQGTPMLPEAGAVPPEMLQAGPQAGEMPGLSTPNPAASSLQGAVAGGLMTGPLNNVGEAGGMLPNAPLPGAV